MTYKTWIIHFEDAGRGMLSYDNEAEARDAYKRLIDNWNCTLYVDANRKMFPILADRRSHDHPRFIPWHIAELAYTAYSAQNGRCQSLERIAERGGFGAREMDDLLPGWRRMVAFGQCPTCAKEATDV